MKLLKRLGSYMSKELRYDQVYRALELLKLARDNFGKVDTEADDQHHDRLSKCVNELEEVFNNPPEEHSTAMQLTVCAVVLSIVGVLGIILVHYNLIQG